MLLNSSFYCNFSNRSLETFNWIQAHTFVPPFSVSFSPCLFFPSLSPLFNLLGMKFDFLSKYKSN